jgi:hypothetical protein
LIPGTVNFVPWRYKSYKTTIENERSTLHESLPFTSPKLQVYIKPQFGNPEAQIEKEMDHFEHIFGQAGA